MKKFIDAFVEKSETLLYGLGIFALVLVLGIRFFLLDKGFIPSDEGWYCVLMRDLPMDSSSRFHLLFKNVFQNNVYLIRLACYLVMLASSMVLALGLKKYFEKVLCKHFPYLFCLGVLFLGQMFIVDVPSFYYVNLNVAIVELSYGFMLLGLANRSHWVQIIAGFTMSFLFPVMITNVMIIPLTIVTLFLLSGDKWKNVGSFCFGVVVFFAYYFAFVESPSDLLDYITAHASGVANGGSEDYGLLFYVDWLYHTVVYYIRLAVIAFLFVMIPVFTTKLKCKNNKIVNVLNVLFAMTVAYYFYKYTKPCVHFNNWWANDIYWISFFILLIRRKYDVGMFPLLALLFLTPLCLSFGTNVDFECRQLEYLVFITPIIFLFAKTGRREKLLLFVSFMFLIILFVRSLFGFNWHQDYYLKQDTPVSTIGIEQNVKLEKKYIDELAFVKKHVDKGETCLVDNESWYFVDLLELQPIRYGFYLPDNPALEQIVDDSTSEDAMLNVICNTNHYEYLFAGMINDSKYIIQKFEEANVVVLKIKKSGE